MRRLAPLLAGVSWLSRAEFVILQADRGCRAWSAADPAEGFGENAQIWQRHEHGPRQGAQCRLTAPWRPDALPSLRARPPYARHHRAPDATMPPVERGALSEKSRRRPTLPGGYPPSTIGAGGLNCRVRNGNGCLSAAMATGNCAPSGSRSRPPGSASEPGVTEIGHPERSIASTSKFPSPRPISTGQLNALPHVHFRPINVVVWPRALPG